jgi:tRNA (guanine37-N1)-methyltransferase
MVMKPEPVYAALDAIESLDGVPARTVLICPQGRPLDQQLVRELAQQPRLILICGRYEGFDERIRARVDLEISIGDYILTGGELPALVIIDAVSRLLPGVLGGETSADIESFGDGLLEYPQYTRPATFRGMGVPEVLLSGDHARIAAWRREMSIIRTAERRPDLIAPADLTENERALARRIVEERENSDRD